GKKQVFVDFSKLCYNQFMKKLSIYILILLIVILLPGIAVGESTEQINTGWETQNQAMLEVASPEEAVEPEPEPEPEPVEIHLMAVGDNLLHMGLVRSGQQEDGSYNFDYEFEDIAPFLEIADIAIINQETPLAGNERGFSGFPRFNSPTEVGDAIVKAGFNVVLGATNHAYDQGAKGLIAYADFFRDNYPDVLMCGIHGTASPDEDGSNGAQSPVEQGRVKLLEIEGYTFAFLNYTYGPNIESFPRELEGHLDMLCPYNPSSRILDFTSLNPQVLEDIAEADRLADVVVVCPHWGTEYTPTPSKYQKEWAVQMTDAGADIIIGAHPHVVQPVEQITTGNGNSSLCYYSLGNYVSTQKVRRSMLEAMAWVTFRDEGDGLYLDYAQSGALGMINQYKDGPLRFEHIYFLEDYTDELAASHGITSWGEGRLNVEDLNTWAEELFGDMQLKKEDIQ
ncbi:MAG: CapA family protein, partial [Acetatifactor sp.]|nr:CapA family protein [Acetatifactor sp.]